MKNAKKVLAVIALIVITAVASVAGTLAYLTDRDSEVNVFTVGDVSIELNEDFAQGTTLIPGVKIEKEPTITNTGKNDAWVWAEIAIPSALDNSDASKNVVHFNYSKESVETGYWNWKDGSSWMVEENVNINDTSYNVYTVLYETVLTPGEVTEYPVITTVYMDTHVDIDPSGEWYWVNNGETTKLEWNSEKNGNPVIYVSAYGIQAEGFETAKAAYDAYGQQWGDKGSQYGSLTVSTAEELSKALAAGEDVVLSADIKIEDVNPVTISNNTVIDLNGYDFDASSSESRPFVVENGASLTINAEDSEIECGAYGFVNVTKGTLNIIGGTFKNKEGNNGSFIRVSGEEEITVNLTNVTYKAKTDDSGVLRTTGTNVTVNVTGGEYEAGMGFIITNGTIDGASITATNTANMWPAVYADGNITVSNSTIKSNCHAVAVGGGHVLRVENCNVTAAEDKLAFQVFSSGGTINVNNCTYTGGYGTTGKVTADAIINIDGEQMYIKKPN